MGLYFASRSLQRLDNAADRACYLCPPILNVPNYFWPETRTHLLLHCTHYSDLRGNLIQHLIELSTSPESVEIMTRIGSDAPDFTDPSVLNTILCLCSGPELGRCRESNNDGSSAGNVLLPITAPSSGVRTRRASANHTIHVTEQARLKRDQSVSKVDMPVSKEASLWLCALLRDWSSHLRSFDPLSSIRAAPGRLLAECVGKYVQDVIRHRRRALSSNADFKFRRRDPVPSSVSLDGAVVGAAVFSAG